VVAELPAPMAELLSSSPGYAMARCSIAGVTRHLTNPAFESAIIPQRELDASLATRQALIPDLISFKHHAVHAQDELALLEFAGKMFGRYVMRDSNAVLSMDGSELVRIIDQRLSAYVPCAVRAMLQLSADYRRMSWALSYTPAGPPQMFAQDLSRHLVDPLPPLAPCRELTLNGWLPTVGFGPSASEREGSSDDSSTGASAALPCGMAGVPLGPASPVPAVSCSGVLPSFGVPVARVGASSGEPIGDLMSEIADEISQGELSDWGLIGEEFLETISVSNR